MKNESGMTLVELVVSTIVLSVVLLAAGTVYVSGVKELQRVSDDSRAQTEAYYLLDHIHKNLMGATGLPTFNADNIVVNIDNKPTPNQIKYAFNSSDKTVEFYPDFDGASTTKETIAKYITTLTFARSLYKQDGTTLINNYVTIQITAQKGRLQESFSTGVVLRGMPAV